MIKVKGKDVILYVYVDGTPVAAICATNVSMRATSGQISTLTMGGGKNRTYKGTVRDATIVLEGVMTLDETGSFQKDDWLDNIGETLHIILTYTDSTGTFVSYDMNILVTEVGDSNPAAEFSTFSISMIRSGPWTKTTGGGLIQLATPSAFSATGVSDSQIDLTWGDVANEVSYNIYVNAINNFGSATLLTTRPANSTSYSHTGLSPSATFYYWIVAVGDGITYSNSNRATDSGTTLAGSGGMTSGITTEGGDFLISESDDFLIQE